MRLRGPVDVYLGVYLPRLRAAITSFTDGDRPGAVAYARERLRTGTEEGFDVLVEDATSAALQFRDDLT